MYIYVSMYVHIQRLHASIRISFAHSIPDCKSRVKSFNGNSVGMVCMYLFFDTKFLADWV